MKVIGLTGNIACGKSTVSSILEGLGAYVIDADVVAKKAMKKGKPAWRAVRDHFGREYIDEYGEIDRVALGNLVFGDQRALEELNALVHPIIVKAIEEELREIKEKNQHRVIVIDAALLIETGCQRLVDEIWLVTLSYEEQLIRLMKRDNLSEQEARQRIESQTPQDIKRDYAHVIIDNSKSIEYTREQVKYNWDRLII